MYRHEIPFDWFWLKWPKHVQIQIIKTPANQNIHVLAANTIRFSTPLNHSLVDVYLSNYKHPNTVQIFLNMVCILSDFVSSLKFNSCDIVLQQLFLSTVVKSDIFIFDAIWQEWKCKVLLYHCIKFGLKLLILSTPLRTHSNGWIKPFFCYWYRV